MEVRVDAVVGQPRVAAAEREPTPEAEAMAVVFE